MKLAIIKLDNNWERGNCPKCPFLDRDGDCIVKASPSSNNGCGLIVDEGDRDKGPLLKYCRDKISNMLQQHEKDQSKLADKLARACKINYKNGDYELKYAITMLKGKTLLEWAEIWLKMDNDMFFEIYGFNFNPYEYPYLYEIARERINNEEK